MVASQTYTELRQLIIDEFDVDTRTAERTIADLRETGVLRFRRFPGDKRKRAYVSSAKCELLFKEWSYPRPPFAGTLRWETEALKLLYPRQYEALIRRHMRPNTAA